MKLPKKYERIAQKQAAYLKKMYETPCEEAQELIRKANERPTMLNGPATHLILMKVGTHWYPQIEQTGESVSDGVNTVHLNFIDYAHQAQILFKALTGNDLKIRI